MYILIHYILIWLLYVRICLWIISKMGNKSLSHAKDTVFDVYYE
jgi:hypothetical protein